MAQPAVLLLALLALLATAAAQTVPSSQECGTRTQALGQQAILIRLQPCQSGPGPECCAQIKGLLAGTGELAFCLCNADVLEATISTLSSSSLAQSAGVTADTVRNLLQQCNTPTAGKPNCPNTAAAAGGGQQGGGVTVTAPGTQVGVTPGGGVGVTAPGARVSAAPTGAGGGGGKAAVGGAGAGLGAFPLLKHKHPLLAAALAAHGRR